MRRLFLTFFYSGLSPWAPGTAGSIVAAFVGALLMHYLPLNTFFLLTILLSIIGVRETNIYEKQTGTHDDKSIVIDEVVGLWLAFVIAQATDNWILIGLCFVYFRIFDIWKPSLIGRIDRNVKGGLGVIGDDLLAGVLAGICSTGTWQLIETYF
jgi:phosphatidylglycerophosphatase A